MWNTCSIGRRWKPREGWSRPVLTGERGTPSDPFLVWWVGSRPVVVSFVGWQGALFSCGHDDDTGEAFGCSRPLSGSRTATIGIVAWFRFCRPIPWWVGRCTGFAVVMAQVRRPVPFRTRKLRPGRGDGTALERVWESSTPPLHMLGLPVEPLAPGRPLFILSFRASRRASLQEPPFFHHLPDLPATPFGLVEGPYPESPPDVRFENHFSL